MRYSLRLIWSEWKKWMKITLAYPLELVGYTLFPLVWVVPFVFQGRALAGGLTSAHFGKFAGTPEFIPYAIVGAVVSTYVFTSLYGMAGSLRYETYWGTLEYLMIAPCPKFALLVGLALQDSAMATFIAGAQILLLHLAFGVAIPLSRVLPLVFVLVLLIAGLYGMAMGLAGLTIRLKETRQVTRSLEQLFFVFTPIRYPVEIHAWTRLVSLFIPLTWALACLRGVVLLSRPLTQMWKEVTLLIGFDILLLAFGYFAFRWVENRSRRVGVVGLY